MNWLQKISGQAIRVTPSMEEYAEKAAKEILSLNEKDIDLSQKQILFNDYVLFEIQNKKVTYQVFLETAPQSESKGAWARGGPLNNPPRSGRITFYLKKPIQNSYEQIYHAVLHELVHVIDPKLLKSFHAPHEHGWNAAKQPDFISGEGFVGVAPGYYNKPWEVDAFMAENATRRAKQWMKYWEDPQELRAQIATVKPASPMEESWYRNPKLWRKYLNTIYQIIQREYAKREKNT